MKIYKYMKIGIPENGEEDAHLTILGEHGELVDKLSK